MTQLVPEIILKVEKEAEDLRGKLSEKKGIKKILFGMGITRKLWFSMP